MAAERAGAGAGFGTDLFAFSMMYIMTRIGDDMDRLGLRDRQQPLLEYVRHLRNAAAHGNRWNFNKGEPRNAARHREHLLSKSMHGQTALFGTVGPGEFLDLLDDLTELLVVLARSPHTSQVEA